MNVKFDIIYDAIRQRLIVSQDGKFVSPYSLFARCNAQPFFNWYEKLPQYCFSEANSRYTVILEGSAIFVEIMRRTFLKDSNCQGVHARSRIITESHRMRWADELLEASGFSFLPIYVPVYAHGTEISLDTSPIFTQIGKAETAWRFSDLKRLNVILRFQNAPMSNIAVVIMTKQEEITALLKDNNTVIIYLLGESGFEFIEEKHGFFIFSCCKKNLAEFLRAWIEAVFIPPMILQLYQSLIGFQHWNGMDAELADVKRELLIARKPYMKLKIPSRIELNKTVSFSFVKLPEDMHCKARPNNPDIALLDIGNIIKPQREGLASFTVTVQDYPEFFVTQSTTIYRYTKVNRIQLTASRSTVTEGERLFVKSVFYPAGAHDIAQAKWTISPDNILKLESQGVFLALKSGYCSISVNVGSVTESISIIVLAKPTRVDFDRKDIFVKLGDNSQCVNANIFPTGSQGGLVRYRVSDTNILNFNDRNGQLIPLMEGDAIITADLLDNGSLIDSCSCHVTVLPPKNIVTPDSTLVFLFLSLLAAIFFYSTPFRFIPCLSAIAFSVWFSFRKKKVIVTVLCVAISLIVCAVMVWGGI